MNVPVSDLPVKITPAAGHDFRAEGAHHLVVPGQRGRREPFVLMGRNVSAQETPLSSAV